MKKIKICYLISEANGGGIASLGRTFCTQANLSEKYEATLLTIMPLTDWLSNSNDFSLQSLECSNFNLAGQKVIEWLKLNPQNVLLINGVYFVDDIIPYLPKNLYTIYSVHDIPKVFYANALRYEKYLDAIVSVSEYVSQSYKHLLVDKNKHVVISNGISLPENVPASQDKYNDIVFLGGNKPFKGALELLTLISYLKKSKYKGNLYWCGTMDKVFKQKILKKKVDFVKIMGRVKQEKVNELLKKSKILLMLSRSEAFGLVTVEAMSYGCIPIAWDVPAGTQEIIVHNESGILVKPLAYKTMVENIQEVFQNHQKYYNACQSHVLQFSGEIMFNKYKDLIDSCLEQEASIKLDENYSPKSIEMNNISPKASLLSKFKQLIKKRINKSFWLSVKLNKYRGV